MSVLMPIVMPIYHDRQVLFEFTDHKNNPLTHNLGAGLW